MLTENQALCKILTKKLGGDDKLCFKIVEDFLNHKDFEKAISELSELLKKPKEEIMDVISTSCIPCEQGEQKNYLAAICNGINFNLDFRTKIGSS